MPTIRRLIASLCFTALVLAAATSSARAESVDQIRNFPMVTPFLFRSGHLEPSNFATLSTYGIANVLTLEDYWGNQSAAANELQLAQSAGMGLSWLPMDGLAKPTLEQIEAALAYIVDPAHQPVLVHCLQGSDRTGMVIAAYRIRYEHSTVADARQEMYRYGHSILLSWWDDLLQEIN